MAGLVTFFMAIAAENEWADTWTSIYFQKMAVSPSIVPGSMKKKVVPHQPFELTRLIRNSRINECLRVAVPYNRITLVCVCRWFRLTSTMTICNMHGPTAWRFLAHLQLQKMRITWVIWCCVACGLQVKKSIIKAKKKWKKRRIVEWRSKMFCVLSNPMKVEKPSW